MRQLAALVVCVGPDSWIAGFSEDEGPPILWDEAAGDWPALEALWRRTYEELDAVPSEHPVIMCGSHSVNQLEWRCMRFLFEELGVPAFYAFSTGNAALAGCQLATGISVDVDGGRARVWPVFEGCPLLPACVELGTGGRRGRSRSDEAADTPSEGAARLASAVVSVLALCPVDTRRELLGHVVLSGGGSVGEDFAERLQAELEAASPAATARLIAKPERRLLAWLGMAAAPALAAFETLWYPRVIHSAGRELRGEAERAGAGDSTGGDLPFNLPSIRSLTEVTAIAASRAAAEEEEDCRERRRRRREAQRVAAEGREDWVTELAAGSEAELRHMRAAQQLVAAPLYLGLLDAALAAADGAPPPRCHWRSRGGAVVGPGLRSILGQVDGVVPGAGSTTEADKSAVCLPAAALLSVASRALLDLRDSDDSTVLQQVGLGHRAGWAAGLRLPVGAAALGDRCDARRGLIGWRAAAASRNVRARADAAAAEAALARGCRTDLLHSVATWRRAAAAPPRLWRLGATRRALRTWHGSAAAAQWARRAADLAFDCTARPIFLSQSLHTWHSALAAARLTRRAHAHLTACACGAALARWRLAAGAGRWRSGHSAAAAAAVAASRRAGIGQLRRWWGTWLARALSLHVRSALLLRGTTRYTQRSLNVGWRRWSSRAWRNTSLARRAVRAGGSGRHGALALGARASLRQYWRAWRQRGATEALASRLQLAGQDLRLNTSRARLLAALSACASDGLCRTALGRRACFHALGVALARWRARSGAAARVATSATADAWRRADVHRAARALAAWRGASARGAAAAFAAARVTAHALSRALQATWRRWAVGAALSRSCRSLVAPCEALCALGALARGMRATVAHARALRRLRACGRRVEALRRRRALSAWRGAMHAHMRGLQTRVRMLERVQEELHMAGDVGRRLASSRAAVLDLLGDRLCRAVDRADGATAVARWAGQARDRARSRGLRHTAALLGMRATMHRSYRAWALHARRAERDAARERELRLVMQAALRAWAAAAARAGAGAVAAAAAAAVVKGKRRPGLRGNSHHSPTTPPSYGSIPDTTYSRILRSPMLVDQLTTSLVHIGLGKASPLAPPRRTAPGDGSGHRVARASREVERAQGDIVGEGHQRASGRETHVVLGEPECLALTAGKNMPGLAGCGCADTGMAAPAAGAAATATRPPAAPQRNLAGTAVGEGERPLPPQPSPALRRAASPHCRRLLSPRIARPRISAGAADRLRTAYYCDHDD